MLEVHGDTCLMETAVFGKYEMERKEHLREKNSRIGGRERERERERNEGEGPEIASDLLSAYLSIHLIVCVWLFGLRKCVLNADENAFVQEADTISHLANMCLCG